MTVIFDICYNDISSIPYLDSKSHCSLTKMLLGWDASGLFTIVSWKYYTNRGSDICQRWTVSAGRRQLFVRKCGHIKSKDAIEVEDQNMLSWCMLDRAIRENNILVRIACACDIPLFQQLAQRHRKLFYAEYNILEMKYFKQKRNRDSPFLCLSFITSICMSVRCLQYFSLYCLNN